VGVRRPLGVVTCFTPWNGANVLAWRPVAQALAAGNTVIVKPSEEAPISAGLVIAQVCEEAGFPPGVVNVITHSPVPPRRSPTCSLSAPRCAAST
jgi:acyl-CoA reductase-like NAD-dependent aldehyde dehydrogenase